MMTRIAMPAVLIAMAVLVACATDPSATTQSASPRQIIAEGTVAQVGTEHGNLYTSISPDAYEQLGLEPGMHVHVAFEGTSLTMVVGETYFDVPSGMPVAVLHREGLTFAIRDGDFSSTFGIEAGAPFTVSAVDAKP